MQVVQLQEEKPSDGPRIAVNLNTPWICCTSNPVLTEFILAPTRLNFGIFKSCFLKNKHLIKDQKEMVKAVVVRESALEMLGQQTHLSCKDAPDLLHGVHVWACKANVIRYLPDSIPVGMLRLTGEKSGDRVIIAFGFADAVKAWEKATGRSSPTVQDVCQFLRDCDSERAKSIRSSIRLHHSVVGEGSLVYIPPGYICVEHVLSQVVSEV